jgi:serine/threonine protein kinase
LNHPFALKFINVNTARERKTESHLQREIHIHSQLVHPNIVRLHHYFYDNPNLVLTLDFCERGTLSDAIKEGALKEELATQMLLQLTSAVHCCHDVKGIFHRDIKPDNILLDSSGTIKLSDFGFATQIEKTGPRLFSVCGTIAFLAPELAKKWKCNEKVKYDEKIDG